MNFSRVPTRRATVALAGFVMTSYAFAAAEAQAMQFKQSSIGYHPKGAKIAILEDVPNDQSVEVVLFDPTRRNPKFPVLLGAPVYKIETTQVFQDPNQQGPATKSILLDFSGFQTPGTYELRVEGTEVKSKPVKLTEYLYWDTLKPVARTFYFQRCGNETEDRQLKVYHAACHLKDAEYLNPAGHFDDYVDVIGGWHNGGDYAKYVTSTSIAASRLMAMHEWNPKPFKYFRMDYPLFEPGYGTMDDLHHEVKAGLDWLMVMQRKDGAMYRKVAGKQWPGEISPREDEQPRYVYGISTQDTANAAAALAMAARDFKNADLGYSVKSLLAAEKAWGFLEDHPKTIYERSASDFSGSGEFLNPYARTDAANRLWAAAELYVATGKEPYHRYFLAHLNDVPLQRFSWMNPSMQGITDYLLYAPQKDPATAASLKAQILRLADGVKSDVQGDIYATGLKQYGMASNEEIAERAALLMVAYRLSGDDAYRDAASRTAHYFFGLNPLGMTYITGLDGKSVSHPTHRWMQAIEKLIPGYVVDGPNEMATDTKTPKGKGASSYVDAAAAKSVNESRILTNASMAYLLALLNDAYNSTSEEAPVSPLDFQLAPERAKTSR